MISFSSFFLNSFIFGYVAEGILHEDFPAPLILETVHKILLSDRVNASISSNGEDQFHFKISPMLLFVSRNLPLEFLFISKECTLWSNNIHVNSWDKNHTFAKKKELSTNLKFSFETDAINDNDWLLQPCFSNVLIKRGMPKGYVIWIRHILVC